MDRALYCRPKKARTLLVRQRQEAPVRVPQLLPEPVAVDRCTECHVTPPAVAQRMVGYLGSLAGTAVLEPSAGTGALIEALCTGDDQANRIVAIEREVSLYDGLQRRFENRQDIRIFQGCFIDLGSQLTDPPCFERIVMNPPFRTCRAHLAAALSVLHRQGKQGATLVALVPDIESSHSVLPGSEVLEHLPAGTFASTDARTRIVRFQV